MAKKLSIGKLVLFGIVAVITLGSVAGLLHGREKDEETAHVHVYEEKQVENETGQMETHYSNICSECGERISVIKINDVKNGYNLEGYAIRLSISEEEFMSKVESFDKNSQTGIWSRINIDVCINFANGLIEDWSTYPYIKLVDWSSGNIVYEDNFVLGEIYSSVREAYNTDGNAAVYFEFYYVGTGAGTEAVSYEAPAKQSEQISAATDPRLLDDNVEDWTNYY